MNIISTSFIVNLIFSNGFFPSKFEQTKNIQSPCAPLERAKEKKGERWTVKIQQDYEFISICLLIDAFKMGTVTL